VSKRRLFSSAEIITALKRAGFESGKKTRGSHQALKRKRADGKHDVAIVVLGKKEVPNGTLQGILTQAGISYEEFLDFAKVKRRGR
jgi:predicted RNA binding protein YcfA (HicA-like mRNA interferase family)